MGQQLRVKAGHTRDDQQKKNAELDADEQQLRAADCARADRIAHGR
jgi:hypothetical protein